METIYIRNTSFGTVSCLLQSAFLELRVNHSSEAVDATNSQKHTERGEKKAERGQREKEMVRKGGVVFDESPPDDFDPANPYKDPVAMLEMREHLVREKWIDIETAKILREKVKWCYRVEGINHLQKCRHLVTQYLESTRGIGWGKDGRPPDLHGPKDLFD